MSLLGRLIGVRTDPRRIGYGGMLLVMMALVG